MSLSSVEPCMDFSPSSASYLARIWAIEALACSSQVDVSLLLELLEGTPEIAEDVGMSARESVSLRILESILAKAPNVNSVPYNAIPKISLDPSELCEDVLRRILTELKCASGINRSEILKWDVGPFIEHKRSSLAKYALQQLKDAICSGKHSSLVSFRERSGLSVENQFKHGAPIDNGKCSDITGRPQKSETDGKNVLAMEQPDESLVPVSRKRIAAEASDSEKACSDQISLRNVEETNGGSIKKQKCNILDRERDVAEMKSSDRDVELVAASKVLMQNNERRLNGLLEKPHDLRLNEPLMRDNECTSSRGVVGIDELVRHADQVYHADGELSRNCAEERDQSHGMGEAKDDRDGFCNLNVTDKDACTSETNVQRNAQSAIEGENVRISRDSYRKCNEETNISSGIRTSDEGPCRQGSLERDHAFTEKQNVHHGTDMPYDNSHLQQGKDGRVEDAQVNMKVLHELEETKEDDEADVVEKKKRFWSSQCTYSQDSVTATDLSDLNLCVKCCNGGKLLVCSSDSCSLMIHDSCLGSDARFDLRGKFYCPFCVYSRAISEYMKLKKQASLARRDLAAFISDGRREPSKKHFRSYSAKDNTVEKENSGLPKCDEPSVRNDVEKATSCRSNKDPQCEPFLRSDHPHLGKKAFGSTSCGVSDTLKNGKREEERVRPKSQPPILRRQDQADASASCKSRGENASTSCQALEESGMIRKETRIGSKKGVGSPPEKDLVHGSKSSLMIRSMEDKGKTEASKKPPVVPKQEKHHTYPPRPEPRRQTIVWTTEEEDLLKEGVKRFSGPAIPWTRILEFGADVFQGRKAIELKNKWRSIMRKAAASK